MINKIMQMKERGERVSLECIDPDGYLSSIKHESVRDIMESIIKSNDITVDHVYSDDMSLRVKYCNASKKNTIFHEELKYFKIKEPSHTFNDLIDVAVQAAKDGVVIIDLLGDCNLIFKDSDGDNVHNVFKNDDESYIKVCLDWIDSRYTETFVIESENDIKKIKEGASVELANGNVFIANKSKHESLAMKDGSKATGLTFKDSNNFWITYSLFELQGATVTQEVSK